MLNDDLPSTKPWRDFLRARHRENGEVEYDRFPTLEDECDYLGLSKTEARLWHAVLKRRGEIQRIDKVLSLLYGPGKYGKKKKSVCLARVRQLRLSINKKLVARHIDLRLVSLVRQFFALATPEAARNSSAMWLARQARERYEEKLAKQDEADKRRARGKIRKPRVTNAYNRRRISIGDCVRIMRGLIADGVNRESEIRAVVCNQYHASRRTYFEARHRLKLVPERKGFGPGSIVYLRQVL